MVPKYSTFLITVITLWWAAQAAHRLSDAVSAVTQSRHFGGLPAAGGSRLLQPPAVGGAAGGVLSAGSAGVGPQLPPRSASRSPIAAQSGYVYRKTKCLLYFSFNFISWRTAG